MVAKAHFGVMVPQIKRTWEETRAVAVAFEDLGYDSLWVNDHLYGPTAPTIPILEAWSTIAALAAVTKQITLGTLVTPAGMRNVAHLGKTIATIDHIAGGRIIPGFGAGWMSREYTDFGVPFLSPKERTGQLREAVTILKRMWGPDETVTFAGTYFQVENLVTEPKPAKPPRLLIGGGGEQVTMKIAAQYADIWNNGAGSQDRIAEKVAVLKRHCDDIGRDFAELTVSQQCLVIIAEDEATVGPMIETAQRIFGGHMGNPAGSLALSGTPDQVAERIQQHIDAGCTMFNIEFFGRDTREPAELFAREILPRFR